MVTVLMAHDLECRLRQLAADLEIDPEEAARLLLESALVMADQ